MPGGDIHRLQALRDDRRGAEVEGDRGVSVAERGRQVRRVPLTVKSPAWTVLVFTGSVRLIIKSTGCVLMMLLQAGVVVVTAKPTRSLSVKASCWEALLIGDAPATHEVTCFWRIAEP